MASARVPDFLPSTSGFAFSNSFPAGIPVVTIPTTVGDIALGDASNGVCGGMVYAAMDLFFAHPRLLPPTATTSRVACRRAAQAVLRLGEIGRPDRPRDQRHTREKK